MNKIRKNSFKLFEMITPDKLAESEIKERVLAEKKKVTQKSDWKLEKAERKRLRATVQKE